jgi:Ser/Thr protein kinase RdoA (MazF antagonist)
LRFSDGAVPEHVAAGILALIERLAPEDGLCHGDPHPANVILTSQGPRLIDWGGAVRAPPALDLACSHVILTELAAETSDDPHRPRTVNAAMQAEYARLAGVLPAALTAAAEPYLAIMRLRVLLGPAGSPALRKRLMRSVETALYGSHPPSRASSDVH